MCLNDWIYRRFYEIGACEIGATKQCSFYLSKFFLHYDSQLVGMRFVNEGTLTFALLCTVWDSLQEWERRVETSPIDEIP